MKNSKTMCFYHPSAVVIVDDNTVFLENLTDNLNQQSKYKLFSSPEKALNYLQENQKYLFSPDDFSQKTHDLATGKSLRADFSKILSLSENKNRFNIPLVAIIDYDMPNISGLQFCSLLGDSYKKIMLTAAADDKVAVAAFNDGIIDKFISKDDPNVFEKIDHAVHTLQQTYFSELSSSILRALETESSTFLTNSVFQDFLKQQMQKNNVVEYYLIDAVGSHLLINEKNERFFLVIQSDQQIENYLHIIQDNDAISEKITETLSKKEKLLCLLSEEDFNQPIEKWSSYLHPAHKIENLDAAYYAFIKAE